MKISELENHHDAYIDSDLNIRAMVADRAFPQVFSLCTESFSHIIPAIKYRKKRGITPETPEFIAFTTIFRYAPPLFEHASIELLSEFVKSSRLLQQSEREYLASIEVAQTREQTAHKLWNHLERQSGMLQRDIRKDLGVSQEDAVNVVEIWEELGIVLREPDGARSYRIYFRTRLDSEVAGRCSNCGVRGKGRKELFFRPVVCRKCSTESHYHIEYVTKTC